MKNLLLLLVILCGGCTSFHAQALRPDGTVFWEVKKIEADIPFLSRESSVEVTLGWLDEKTNTYFEGGVKQFNESDARRQSEFLEELLKAVTAVSAAKAGGM